MTGDAVTPAPALRVLLEGLIDYAGLFPPASLGMSAAVSEYAGQRHAPTAWALGRFVCPERRLHELAREHASVPGDEQWLVSALADTRSAAERERIHRFNSEQAGGLHVDVVEVRATTPAEITAAYDVFSAFALYVEIPLGDDPRSLLVEIARRGVRAKVRTGAVVPEGIPPVAELARFIVRCVELAVPFKATAGLHHPVRGEQPLTYEDDAPRAVTFGFLNVFLAAAFALDGADESTVARILDERDPLAFGFHGGHATWRAHSLSLDRLHAGRELALAFGSCSVREPLADLQALRLL